MTSHFQPKLLLGAASALLVASCVWFGWQEVRLRGRRHRASPPAIALASSAYVATGRDAPAVKARIWEAPSPQRSGHDWIYEVFTPPEIFYDASARQFSVSLPRSEPVPAIASEFGAPAPFGLELIGVKHPLFRLQLVGYAGGEGNYRGLFENTLTTETFLACRGRRLPALELTIEEFEVRRQLVPLAESMTTRRLVAIAVLRDERSGERVQLTDQERYHPASAVAVVATAADGAPREVHEGDRIEAGTAVFRIDKIQPAPPSVDVTKMSADQLTERRTLIVPPQAPAAPPPPSA